MNWEKRHDVRFIIILAFNEAKWGLYSLWGSTHLSYLCCWALIPLIKKFSCRCNVIIWTFQRMRTPSYPPFLFGESFQQKLSCWYEFIIEIWMFVLAKTAYISIHITSDEENVVFRNVLDWKSLSLYRLWYCLFHQWHGWDCRKSRLLYQGCH